MSTPPRRSNAYLEKHLKLAQESLHRRNAELLMERKRSQQLAKIIRQGSPWQRFRLWMMDAWNPKPLEM